MVIFYCSPISIYENTFSFIYNVYYINENLILRHYIIMNIMNIIIIMIHTIYYAGKFILIDIAVSLAKPSS
jgi:hypothetical protein